MKDDFGWRGEGVENPEDVMAIMGEDAEETQCVRQGLVIFETRWLFPISEWLILRRRSWMGSFR